MMNLGTLLEAAAKETGLELVKTAAEVTAYAAQRALHLASIVGESGYDEALTAEADSVALFAGIHAVKAADAADARLLGIIQGALMAAAAGGV